MVKGFTRGLTVGLAIGLATALNGAPLAWAQSAEQGADAASVAEPAPQSRALDEIIVTAQKRSEDVRDVPLAVSVMSGEELRDSAITNFNELAAYIPNVSINTDWFSLYIRGIGTAEYSQLAEQAVGYFIDGVYLGRIEFLRAGFVDVGQLEVLKGPQGTLFGRNAAAGVITVSTNPASYEWQADAAATYGQRKTLDLRGAVSGPVIKDRLAIRLAGSHNSNDGYIENLVTGKNMDERHSTFLRFKARLDATETLSFKFGASWFDYAAGPFGGTEVTAMPAEYQPVFMTLDPTFELDFNRKGSRTTEPGSYGEENTGDGLIFSLQMDWDIWGHTITSITSRASYSSLTGGDIDGSAAPIGGLQFDQSYTQFSEELRIASDPGTFEYLIGLFYLHANHDGNLRVPLLANVALSPLLGPLLPDAVDGLLFSLLGPLGQMQLLPADDVTGRHRIKIDSYAVFGQAKWNVLDNLALIVGLRYTYDIKSDDASITPSTGSVIWTLLVQGGYTTYAEQKDTDFSPKLSVTWDPVEWATLYATYAQGFKAGSFNIAALSAAQVTFGAENANSYEIGLKTELLGGAARFNLSAHWTDYDDLQIATFQTVAYNVTNAPRARTRGVEADLTALVAEGLIINGAIAYNDGTFEEFPNGPCPAASLLDIGSLPPEGPGTLPPNKSCDLSGQQLHRSPTWSGSARIAYQRQLGNWPVAAMIGFDATFKDDEKLDADLDPLDAQDAHWLFNARIGFSDIDGLWSLTLSGKNLSDKITKVFGGDVPLFYGTHWATANAPRSFTAALRVKL